MVDRFPDDAQYFAVIANLLRPFGINLAADIGQQRIVQVAFEAAAVDGGVKTGADNGLLRRLAPIAIAQ